MAHSSPEPPDRSTGSAARNTRRPRHRPDTGPAIRIREEKRPMKRRRTRILALAATALAVLAGIVYVQGPAEAATTRYEAENATTSQGVVESNHLGFSGTGFVNTDNVVGSSVTWNVNADTAGNATLAFRFANGTTTSRPMDIAVNGTVVSAAFAFPGTGSWDTWQTRTLTAALNAGPNSVKATATTSNGGPNLDWLEVTTAAAFTDFQAENATLSQAVVATNHTGFTGTGFVDYNNVAGSFVQFTVTAGSSGPQSLAFRYANGSTANRPMDIAVNGTVVSAGLAFNPTTDWDTWATVTINATLNAGSNTVRATATGAAGGPNLDRLRVSIPTDTVRPTPPGQPVCSNIMDTSLTLAWGASTDNKGVTAYNVRNSNNGVVFTVTGNPPATTTTVTGLPCGSAQSLHVVARDAAGNTSAPSNTVNFTTSACGRGTLQTPTTVTTGWTIPWDICWIPGRQQALVTERDDFRVTRVNVTGTTKTLLGRVPNAATTDGEGGLMGCAFSPDWNGTTDQDVFFMHTSPTDNRVVRMTYDGTTLSTTSTPIVTGIRRNRFHNGGRIRFGPDGFLYITTGEAQQPDLAQDRNSLNGKILRVTKSGAPAPGNPFGTRIYSYGHRNPQGIAWDSAGNLWESEFGNATWDEINLILPGRNYGWPTCEGACNMAGLTDPKWQRSPSVCSCSGIAIVNATNPTTGTSTSHFVGTFGRIRAVVKIPGVSAIWFGTSNADNNGGQPDGSDVIRRSNIQ